MEIMKLIPTGKDYLWGGTRLRKEYGKKIDLTPLAETWSLMLRRTCPFKFIRMMSMQESMKGTMAKPKCGMS